MIYNFLIDICLKFEHETLIKNKATDFRYIIFFKLQLNDYNILFHDKLLNIVTIFNHVET